MSSSVQVNRRLPVVLGVLLFGVIIWMTELLIQTQQRSNEMSREIDQQTNLFSMRDKVDRSLQSILHLSIGITAYVDAKAGQLEEKEVMELMASLYRHTHSNHVKNFGLIEGTTIRYVYPPEGNEAALGVDLKQVPQQWPAVLTAMNSDDGVLVGPVDLIQGGTGLIFRMPLFVEGKYWGLFNTIIDMESYLEDISTYRGFTAGDFAVRTSEVLLVGKQEVFDHPLVRYADVAVPGGVWQLGITPAISGDESFTAAWRFLGWAFALFMGFSVAVILIQRGKLQGLALIDELTGAANRRQFDLMLERFCQKYNRRDSGRFALLFLDLDRFKAINDSHGHKAGDYFLVEISRRISHAIRGGDLLARWGGDEFAIIVDNPTDTNIDQIVSRVQELTEQAVIWRDQKLMVGASIGVVHYPEDGETPEELVNAADQYMYKNKRSRDSEATKTNPG